MRLPIDPMMRRWRVSAEALGIATDRPLSVVIDWRTGLAHPPPYIAYTVEAVGRHLAPADDETMRSKGDRLAAMLHVEQERVDYWHRTRQYPQAARLAVATLSANAERPLTTHERHILKLIMLNHYYRVRGGWRPKAALGAPVQSFRYNTPRPLISRGLVEITPDGRLHATKKGRDAYYA